MKPVTVLRSASVMLIASIALGASPRLDFEVQEGPNLNRLFREGPVAAHLLLRAGPQPRILVAFPAGDSGVGVWFEQPAGGGGWTVQGSPRPVHETDTRGRALYGIAADASLQVPLLKIHEAVLSSIRVLRDYQLHSPVPPGVAVSPSVKGRTIRWARERLDGAAGYRLSLEVTDGALRDGEIRAGPDGRIGLRITALTGETPLTPLSGRELLSDAAGSDPAARDTLTFLAYREKLLAGSWRFDTYFGRDTLHERAAADARAQPDGDRGGALLGAGAALAPEAKSRTKRISASRPCSII